MDKSSITGSADFRKINRHLFPTAPVMDDDDAHRATNRVRQRTKKISKLELEWGEVVRISGTTLHLRNNAIALRLANGCVYWPDWTGVETSGRWIAWEVKGERAWDDAIVKLKVAAGQYPEILFVLVSKVDGKWHEQVILP